MTKKIPRRARNDKRKSAGELVFAQRWSSIPEGLAQPGTLSDPLACGGGRARAHRGEERRMACTSTSAHLLRADGLPYLRADRCNRRGFGVCGLSGPERTLLSNSRCSFRCRRNCDSHRMTWGFLQSVFNLAFTPQFDKVYGSRIIAELNAHQGKLSKFERLTPAPIWRKGNRSPSGFSVFSNRLFDKPPACIPERGMRAWKCEASWIVPQLLSAGGVLLRHGTVWYVATEDLRFPIRLRRKENLK